MSFHTIDFESWPRRDVFNHFSTIAKSTYSLTVHVDITDLITFIRQRNFRLYPTFTWIVSNALNNHTEFKMALDETQTLGYYDTVSPAYAVFHPEIKLSGSLCTPFTASFRAFYQRMTADMEAWEARGEQTPSQADSFVVSCLPWLNYASFSCNNESGALHLFPMIVWGKYFEQGSRTLMPLTLQIHHAVADGYHCARFYEDVQNILTDPAVYLK